MTAKALAKRYTLTDGSVWTAVELAERLNLTATAARYRLNYSNNVKWVMRKNTKSGEGRSKNHVTRRFTIDDGTTLSTEELAKRFDVPISTMYARLSRGNRDVLRLSKKPTQGKRSDQGFIEAQGKSNENIRYGLNSSSDVRKMLKQRNSIHPMGRLFLMMGS